MKKIVLVFGLISGCIITAMMIVSSIMCYNNDEAFEPNMVLGYAAMLVAFSFIFVGIKNYRDKYNKGVISFGKAFKAGFFITLIASTMYVLAWLAEYYIFIPDFLDKYADHMINYSKAQGITGAGLKSVEDEIAMYRQVYKTPFGVIAMTYLEVLPIGTIVSLISALILKKKQS